MPSNSNTKQVEQTDSLLLAQVEQILPSQIQTPERTAFAQQATQEIQQALTRLSAKKPRFRSSGITLLGFTEYGTTQEVPLAIRSVPFETTARLVEEAYVEPPRSKKMNIETMEFEMVKDEHDPAYQRKLQQANTLFLKRYTLYALNCELEDEQGNIVWDPVGGIYQEAAALRVLELQGFTSTHYTQIREDAERLSMTEQQQVEAARTKKSLLR